ncbi:hypothetical protein [uncultured Arsenicicoccus sp.]|uniref:hypothetical protein n=1 Tax=uncultured Arsenicicoccus sp. TaxID=491339 RepID=UPI0025948C91|nr:hypothetical protein [uncultured Arsenicicoccus sp.]
MAVSKAQLAALAAGAEPATPEEAQVVREQAIAETVPAPADNVVVDAGGTVRVEALTMVAVSWEVEGKGQQYVALAPGQHATVGKADADRLTELGAVKRVK